MTKGSTGKIYRVILTDLSCSNTGNFSVVIKDRHIIKIPINRGSYAHLSYRNGTAVISLANAFLFE